jgi:hypothetical protein
VRRHRGEATAIGAIGVLALAALFSWQGAARLLEDVSTELVTSQQERQEALRDQEAEFRQRTMHWALSELYALRRQAADARSDSDRDEVMERMLELIERAGEIDPEFEEPGYETLFSLFHERGVADDRALAVLDEQIGERSLREQLRLRAAALTGLEDHAGALSLHRQRTRLDPRDPDPRIDAARTLRRIATLARGEDRDALARHELARRELARALAILAPALEFAVAARDEEAVVEILIERGRCFLDLDDLYAARDDLERAKVHDSTSFETQMLLFACDRRLSDRPRTEAEPARTTAVGAPQAAAAEPPDDDGPALTIDALIPRREELANELETAGRGFRSIYGALKGLLDEQPGEAPEEVEPPQTPPDGAGNPGGG